VTTGAKGCQVGSSCRSWGCGLSVLVPAAVHGRRLHAQLRPAGPGHERARLGLSAGSWGGQGRQPAYWREGLGTQGVRWRGKGGGSGMEEEESCKRWRTAAPAGSFGRLAMPARHCVGLVDAGGAGGRRVRAEFHGRKVGFGGWASVEARGRMVAACCRLGICSKVDIDSALNRSGGCWARVERHPPQERGHHQEQCNRPPAPSGGSANMWCGAEKRGRVLAGAWAHEGGGGTSPFVRTRAGAQASLSRVAAPGEVFLGVC